MNKKAAGYLNKYLVCGNKTIMITTKQKADLLVEQVQQLASSSKLMHEKLDRTNEWHGQQNSITMKLLIFTSVCSFLTTVFLGLIYFNL